MNRRYKIHTIDSSINISCPISDNKKQNDLNQEDVINNIKKKFNNDENNVLILKELSEKLLLKNNI